MKHCEFYSFHRVGWIIPKLFCLFIRNKVDQEHFIRFAAEWFQKLFVDDEKKRTEANKTHTPAAEPAKDKGGGI